jgi:Tfp pilus assembly protein PilX
MIRRIKETAGFVMPMVLAVIVAMTIIFAAVAQLVTSNISLVSNNIKSQKALNIAEAGINYYLWHLSHNATDFRDGKTTPASPDPQLGYGPYVHNYVDDNTDVTGTYTLWISPQGNGSSIMKVRSIGKVSGTNFTRTVEAQIGAPSFASYAVVSDNALWFGANEQANGPVHSNQGVRMDGQSTGEVSSARATYTPSVGVGGDGSSHPGVWCSPSVVTPINCNTRPKDTWIYPTTSIDYNQVSNSLCTMKKVAFGADPATVTLAGQANACSQTPSTRTASYLPQRSNSGSFASNRGYMIQLNNNGTYDVWQVNGENDTQTPYTSALNLQSVATGVAIPSTGTIFVEDNVWIRTNPTFTGRVTIGAGRLASASTGEINIIDNLLYSTKNGTTAIGLVSEGNINVSPYAAPTSGSFTLEINAAVLAQTGFVVYPSTYHTNSAVCSRGWVNPNQLLKFYGSVATRTTWTWSWLQGTSSCGDAVNDGTGQYISGFLHNITEYDYNLLYNAPPNFPLTSTYNILSWREVLTKP